MLGPLLGYGFLAGATMRVPDDPARPRRLASKLAGATGGLGGDRAVVGRSRLYRGVLRTGVPGKALSRSRAVGTREFPHPGRRPGLTWLAQVGCRGSLLVVIWAYAWLWPAWFCVAAGGADRPSGNARCVRGIVDGRRVCRLALRQFLGGYRRCGEVTSLILALCRCCSLAVGLAVMSGCSQHDHLRRDAAPRALSRDAGGLGAWPGADVAVVEPAAARPSSGFAPVIEAILSEAEARALSR